MFGSFPIVFTSLNNASTVIRVCKSQIATHVFVFLGEIPRSKVTGSINRKKVKVVEIMLLI